MVQRPGFPESGVCFLGGGIRWGGLDAVFSAGEAGNFLGKSCEESGFYGVTFCGVIDVNSARHWV